MYVVPSAPHTTSRRAVEQSIACASGWQVAEQPPQNDSMHLCPRGQFIAAHIGLSSQYINGWPFQEQRHGSAAQNVFCWVGGVGSSSGGVGGVAKQPAALVRAWVAGCVMQRLSPQFLQILKCASPASTRNHQAGRQAAGACPLNWHSHSQMLRAG